MSEKENKKYSLTKKGKEILEDNNFSQLYEIIFKTYTEKFNWGFTDRYEEFPLIQSTVIFNLYTLKQKATGFIDGDELGEIFLKAFPDLTREVSSTWSTPEKKIIDCYQLRFLERFCIPFGFAVVKKEGNEISLQKCYYNTTTLFHKCLAWRI